MKKRRCIAKREGVRRTLELGETVGFPRFGRKAFVQVIEVAIAALLIVLVLPAFFSWLNVKQDWARHDLLVSGTGIVRALEAGGNLSQIFNNTQDLVREIEAVKPPNVKYSIYAEGLPKQNISVACVSANSQACGASQLSFLRSALSFSWLNGIPVNFSVDGVSIDSVPSIPQAYDIAFFMDYADGDWTAQKRKISDFLNSSKGVIALQGAPAAASGADFEEIFNLSNAGGNAVYQNFTSYYPAGTDVAKYFLAFGFDIATPDDAGFGYRSGTWRIWDSNRIINTTGTKAGFADTGIELAEGGKFSLSENGKPYEFKVKAIRADRSGVVIQPLNKSFPFADFLNPGEKKVEGNNILFGDGLPNSYSLAARNGNAVWISGNSTEASHEYKTLVKAAVAAITEMSGKVYIVRPQNVKDSVNVETFMNLCCDSPDVARLTFSFWYVY